MTPTYITPAEARVINTALASLTDSELNVLIYISEAIIDQYIGIPTDNNRIFPIDGAAIPADIKYVCAMLCSSVKASQAIGDPTMGGVILKESALDRSVDYSGKKVQWVDLIPSIYFPILDPYKFSSNGNVSGYSLIQDSVVRFFPDNISNTVKQY